ncbi:MAG: hypothetical protein M0Q92_10000 [Methanoregula sp.]|jgi:hypothetical protein|nr:hypothetical protein [Methanoregula sp.]
MYLTFDDPGISPVWDAMNSYGQVNYAGSVVADEYLKKPGALNRTTVINPMGCIGICSWMKNTTDLMHTICYCCDTLLAGGGFSPLTLAQILFQRTGYRDPVFYIRIDRENPVIPMHISATHERNHHDSHIGRPSAKS